MTRSPLPPESTVLRIATAEGAVHEALRFGAPAAGRPLVLHLHGGAFVGAPPAGLLPALPRLLLEAGACVVSLRYPLAPAHPFPAALEAAYAALAQLQRESPALLLVAGEEAGGNLAAGVARLVRDRRELRLAGQILCSALLDPQLGTLSQRQARCGQALAMLEQGWRCYAARPGDAGHPYAAPAHALRLQGLAPAWLLTAEDDPFRDEMRAYARRLAAQGVRCAFVCLPAPTHFPMAYAGDAAPDPPWRAAAREALRRFLVSLGAPL